MQPRAAALLWDLLTATKRIQEFVAGKTWEEYAADVLLRSGVERQFEIAGEAMSVLRKEDPDTAARVPEVHKIIGMRNVLIHGYAEISNLTVWRTATGDLQSLVEAVDALLIEAGPPAS
ncbi:DUF86 domain-containing protein [Nocardioides luteus]|uniref:DUF86 domain-containing protein n=2 Tax=Nocardioides luteus TaxID=1844 RepID=A0ABQ5SZV7_9ACTN|nr:DUF86 domain-containing protein [Nocardioides luteus]GLJ69356.1 DUF86 domain-containing protein [Nocardioides luteus]